MGICISCEAATVTPLSTAKLVLEDGKLQEFSCPVKAWQVLGKDRNTCFVCSADAMEFDGLVSALGADEDLQLGHLYFVLPRSMLRYPLHPKHMAALAIKASAALMSAASTSLVFPEEVEKSIPSVKRWGGGRGRGRIFTSKLSAIPE